MARETYVVKTRPDGTIDVVPKDRLQAWLVKYSPPSKLSTLKLRKVERGSWVWRDGKLIQKSAQIIQFKNRLQVIKDSEPFLNIAVDNGYIGGRKQRRDMMKAHNLIEVGTEPPVNRKQYDPFNPRAFAEDVKHAYRQHGVDAL